ncbi:MAG TPA: DUF4265 domain-containing protein [Candidatus Dormibacteraeota bacterium]|nr:DUF4265 domain-containing protein [Candidatus Dormibacteraeota bacterium]
MSNLEEYNYVVEVRFEIEKDADGYPKSRNAEALLCKPLDPECSLCIVASVPLYLRNIAYGDTIRTKPDSGDSLEFGQVVKRGGYSVYRVLLHDPSRKDAVIRHFLDLGALVEHDGDLIAVAVPPTANVDAIADYILTGKDKDYWGAQDGYIFEPS